MTRTRTTKPLLLVAVSGAAYGFLGVFGTWIMAAGSSVTNLSFWRFASAALLIAALRPRTAAQPLSRHTRATIALSALFYALGSALFFYTSQRIGTGLAMVIFFSYPIFVLLWARASGTQRIGPRSWACLLTVSAGLTLIGNPAGGRFDVAGIACGLMTALAYGAYMILTKRVAHHVAPQHSSLLLCTGCAAYFGVAALADGTLALPHTLALTASIVGLGGLSTALPVVLLQMGIKGVSAAKASMVSILEPVVTVLMGALLLGESMGPPQAAGVGLVLAGATYAALLPEQNTPTVARTLAHQLKA